MKFNQKAFFKDIDFHPRPDQWEIMNCPAKVRCLSGGVRLGKSVMSAAIGLAETFHPHKIEYPTWIVSSSYDNSDAIFEPMYWIAKTKLGLLSKRCSLKYRII